MVTLISTTRRYLVMRDCSRDLIICSAVETTCCISSATVGTLLMSPTTWPQASNPQSSCPVSRSSLPHFWDE